jgi:hypothetical protein
MIEFGNLSSHSSVIFLKDTPTLLLHRGTGSSRVRSVSLLFLQTLSCDEFKESLYHDADRSREYLQSCNIACHGCLATLTLEELPGRGMPT